MIDQELSLRTDPDVLLDAIKKKKKSRSGRLYLFIGMAPGVGKTYAMLQAAHEAKKNGMDVVVGVAETHGRVETERLLTGLEIVSKKAIEYREKQFFEMDIDTILERKPGLAIVDELAHTNIPGSRHNKRWQDVIELLDNGIHVYSTLNVQHLESRKDAVEEIAKITISETVPDSVLDRAFQIQLIDLSPPDLLRRLKEGKVYLGDKAELAAGHFFREEKLTALREIALRLVAERVDVELKTFATEREAGTFWPATDRLMVAVDHSEQSEKLIRVARKMAYNLDASWVAVHISTGGVASDDDKLSLANNLELARKLGADIVMAADTCVVDGLIRIARQKDITQLLMGRSSNNWLGKFFKTSILDQLLRKSSIDISVIGPKSNPPARIKALLKVFKIQSSFSNFSTALIFTALLIGLNLLLAPLFGQRAVGFLLLLGILFLGLFLPIGPVMLAAVVSMIGWNFFFIPPVGTFHVTRPEDIFLCLSYFMAAIATGILTRRNKYQQEILINREIRSETLRRILLDVASAPSPRAVLSSVIKRIELFLNGRCDVALLKKDKSLAAFLEQRLAITNAHKEMAVAKWVADNNKAAGRYTETLSSADSLYIPIKGLFDMMGVLGFQAKKSAAISVEDMDFLFIVARQLAMALEMENLRKRALESEKYAESEKLHQMMLTQLIIDMKNFSTKNDFINDDLLFLMDNFSLVSRLSTGIFPLKKEIIKERNLLEAALLKVAHISPPTEVKIHDSDGDSQVLVEPESMIQAVANILKNALQHSPTNEIILIEIKNGEIIISDRGQGVAEENLGRIFDKNYRGLNNKFEGHGLGLYIAKSVIKAHEGRILATSQPEGGLIMTISLPRLSPDVRKTTGVIKR